MRAVVSDVRVGGTLSGTTVTGVEAKVLAYNDYYPFGMQMPNFIDTDLSDGDQSDFRSFNSGLYRYGFNGKEREDGVEASSGSTTYDYGFRIYNPAIGRFLSVDPLTSSYPWYTPYQFAGNNPVNFIDLDGLEQAKKLPGSEKSPPVKKQNLQSIIEESQRNARLINEKIDGLNISPIFKNEKRDLTFQIVFENVRVIDGKVLFFPKNAKDSNFDISAYLDNPAVDHVIGEIRNELLDEGADLILDNFPTNKVLTTGAKVVKRLVGPTAGAIIEVITPNDGTGTGSVPVRPDIVPVAISEIIPALIRDTELQLTNEKIEKGELKRVESGGGEHIENTLNELNSNQQDNTRVNLK